MMDSELLTNRVRDALAGNPITVKRMFGGTTFLLNGNMLCCVSDKGLMARVGAAAEPAALRQPYAAPCLGAGRRMAGFILIQPQGVATGAGLTAWLEMARAHVGDLPPKQSKSAKQKTKRR